MWKNMLLIYNEYFYTVFAMIVLLYMWGKRGIFIKLNLEVKIKCDNESLNLGWYFIAYRCC